MFQQNQHASVRDPIAFLDGKVTKTCDVDKSPAAKGAGVADAAKVQSIKDGCRDSEIGKICTCSKPFCNSVHAVGGSVMTTVMMTQIVELF